MVYTRPKGTQDVLPQESWKWQYVEEKARMVAHRFGFKEIRLPTFESTEVFSRGVGEDTDIVSKEMYTFLDKGERSVTLRPEGTAGVARAVLENGMLAASPLPIKTYYLQSCFRYENSQKGRYREFHQFGVECFGTHEPMADVEIIALAAAFLSELGLEEHALLQVNAIGCKECRPKYHKALLEYFDAYKDEQCSDCRQRIQNNPLRLLDCKEEKCIKIAKNAPVILDYLCEDCHNHFEEVKRMLQNAEIAYEVNPRIVRGLDYYTNTVFEFVAAGIGTQGTVCGGGRYDGLIEEFGGEATPGVGFGLGLERLLMLLEEHACLPAAPQGPVLFAVAQGEKGRDLAAKLVKNLRNEDIFAEYDLVGRSVKAQMKAAGRLGALYTVVMGDSEVESGIVSLKRMHDGAQAELPVVGAVAVVKHVLRLDPAAVSVENLEEMIRTVGPIALFDDGEAGY